MHDMYTNIVLLKYKTNNKDWDVAAISACIMLERGCDPSGTSKVVYRWLHVAVIAPPLLLDLSTPSYQVLFKNLRCVSDR